MSYVSLVRMRRTAGGNHARTRKSAKRRVAVLLLYQHRLFRDVISGLLAQSSAIRVIETTRNKENGLRLLEDLGDLSAQRIFVIVEAQAQLNFERGALAFILREAQLMPRVHVMALSLGGSGISIYRWRWLERVDSKFLIDEMLR